MYFYVYIIFDTEKALNVIFSRKLRCRQYLIVRARIRKNVLYSLHDYTHNVGITYVCDSFNYSIYDFWKFVP